MTSRKTQSKGMFAGTSTVRSSPLTLNVSMFDGASDGHSDACGKSYPEFHTLSWAIPVL
jgi:hypothetical protein